MQSANDGCIILAEGIAGSEPKFAEMMNARAKEIGLKNSTFVNSTGLPDPQQRVSLTDLVALARHINKEYPEYYRTYAQDNFTWNNIFQRNRNPLLRLDIGADGMGTGYTEQSGYGIVGAADKERTALYRCAERPCQRQGTRRGSQADLRVGVSGIRGDRYLRRG